MPIIKTVGVIAKPNAEAAGTLVPKLIESATLSSFEVYGDPGPEARKVLAGLGAVIFDFKNGLGR